MANINFMSFSEELVKIAFNPLQANKVLGLAKKMQLPKASNNVVSRIQQVGAVAPAVSSPAFIPSPQNFINNGTKMLNDLSQSPKFLNEAVPALKQVAANFSPLTGKIPQGVIVPGSNVNKLMQEASHTHIPANQKKMLHAVTKGHELDESTVRPMPGATQFGHRSPDVIYREHNRIVTLPPENAQVQQGFSNLRNAAGAEGPTLMGRFNMQYGKSPRLSRHARKRMTEAVSKDTIDQTKKELAKHGY